MITRLEGRKGEPTEYVEFQIGPRLPAFAAQKSGYFWHVFEIWPGKSGRVATLHTTTDKSKAVRLARQAARKFTKATG